VHGARYLMPNKLKNFKKMREASFCPAMVQNISLAMAENFDKLEGTAETAVIDVYCNPVYGLQYL
jgi:hypothetical protein